MRLGSSAAAARLKGPRRMARTPSRATPPLGFNNATAGVGGALVLSGLSPRSLVEIAELRDHPFMPA
jgi:hypothetical protein